MARFRRYPRPETPGQNFEVARRSPDVQHWLPTREAWTAKYQDRAPA